MKDETKRFIDRIIKIILIIIIIILLLHECGTFSKPGSKTEPGGNVDIIDIDCDKEDGCDSKPVSGDDDKPDDGEKTDDDKNKGSGNKSDNGNQNNEPDEDDNDGDLIVEDKYITWNGVKETKIFEKTMYVKEERIAPESSNVYQFIVKNNTVYNLKYKINFIENNPLGINMKYKLKKNDTYIIDHYVSANKLATTDLLLNADDNDTFYLEWKWISSDNDTKIGQTPNASYGLKIEIEAESTNG
jgi:hypothetical protein